MTDETKEKLDAINVTLLKYPTANDWILCRKCTLVTVGKDGEKEPSMQFKKKLLAAKHSPIRVLDFAIRLENVPYCTSVHFCRHVHLTPFVRTQRNDRQSDYDRSAARQDAPVDMILYLNAEELMTLANKRLCTKAEELTREITKKICNAVLETNPEFDGLLVPNCIYRGGVCTEFEPCGFNKSYGLFTADLSAL